jgi:hypothetical protein
LQIKTKIVSCHTTDSKPVKQEVNGTVILPSPFSIPCFALYNLILLQINDGADRRDPVGRPQRQPEQQQPLDGVVGVSAPRPRKVRPTTLTFTAISTLRA